MNDAEAEELRAASDAAKFRQLVALWATPWFPGEREARDQDIVATREVWQRLRAAYARR